VQKYQLQIKEIVVQFLWINKFDSETKGFGAGFYAGMKIKKAS
jgi:hypothetical protein